MDYGIIVKRSFEFAWRYKMLWIFGVFVSGVTSLNLDVGDSTSLEGEFGAFDPASISPELAFQLLGIVLILGLLLYIAYCISAPALVDAANRVARGGEYSFGASFSAGIDFFFRSAGLLILIFLMGLAVIAVLALIAIVIIAALGVGVGQGDMSDVAPAVILSIIIGFLIGLPILIFVAWVLTTLHQLAQRALVVRDISIADSLGEAWFLLKNHFGKCVVIFLIYFGIGMGVSFLLGMIFLVIRLVVHGFLAPGVEGLAQIFVISLLAGLPFSLLIGGFFGTAFFNMYTLFYFALVDPSSLRQSDVPSPQPLV